MNLTTLLFIPLGNFVGTLWKILEFELEKPLFLEITGLPMGSLNPVI